MYLRLSILIVLFLSALAATAEASDHLAGTVTAQDRAKGTIVVLTHDDDERAREVTVHMKNLPEGLRTGSLVRAHGRFLSDDHTRFEAERLRIKHDDPSGVRARLHTIPRTDHDHERPVIRIPDVLKLPERSR